MKRRRWARSGRWRRRRRCSGCRPGPARGWGRGTLTWRSGCAMSRVERAGRAALRIRVRGVVQGVGYRPFVWRLARRLGLAGWVRNDAEGVLIHAEGPPARLGRLLALLRRRAPKAAAVSAVTGEPAAVTGHTGFRVAASDRYAAGGAVRVPA